MRVMLVGVLVAVGNLMAAMPGLVPTPVGPMEGVAGRDAKVTVFRGIPYAEPPVGELRWRPPVAAKAEKIARRMQKFGASCVQAMAGSRLPWTAEFMAHGETSEDCLTLNVWTAAAKADEGRPVVVFLHGGGYREGSGSIAVYDGEAMALAGVVFVTVNYRLGALGYMAHPELTKESAKGASGNYGLMDQIEALRWVKANIAAFGGDPAKVTVAGQSAGAGSVAALAASPEARGLFHRAVAESGTGIAGSMMAQRVEAERQGAEWMEKLGAKTLKEMRALPAVQACGVGGKGVPPMRPIVDGWILPESPIDAVRGGRFANVPYMTGYNADESRKQTMDAEKFAEWARQRFGDLTEEFLKLYQAGDLLEVARDRNRASMWLWAEARAQKSAAPTYLYFFTREMPWPEHPEFGAFHTSEVPYLYGNLRFVNHPVTGLDEAISQKMVAWLVQFAKTGDPNAKGLPEWPAFDAKEAVVKEVGETFQPMRVATRARLAFWRKFLLSADGQAGNVFF